jgi:hypothetical protein
LQTKTLLSFSPQEMAFFRFAAIRKTKPQCLSGAQGKVKPMWRVCEKRAVLEFQHGKNQ